MIYSLAALFIGFIIDLLVGDPHGLPHPVVLIGKLIAALEKVFRALFPKTPRGENLAGAAVWIVTAGLSAAVPWLILRLCGTVSPWLRMAVESVMCWQILATRSLRDESMKVYAALQSGDLTASRKAVSMIVGRDVEWPGPRWRPWRKIPLTGWWRPCCFWRWAARRWDSFIKR